MEQINLNVIPNGAMPVCHVSQYDKGRTIRLNLFDGDNVYTLTGDETLELDVKKPDTTIVTANVVNTADSYVEIVTTEQMAACSGNNFCELRISMGGSIIGSLNFIMACEKSPLEGGVESESAIENLDTQVAALVAEEVASQYDASDVIFDSEPTEGHGIGYAVTSEGVLNAINNALDFEDEAGPASIVSFDNAAALPVVDLVADITAVQTGSGTPSPDNERPITTYTEMNVGACGKNLFNADKIVSDSNHPSSVYIDNGYLRFITGNVSENNITWDNLKFPCPLKFSGKIKNFDTTTASNIGIRANFSDGTNEGVDLAASIAVDGEVAFEKTIGTSGKIVTSIVGRWTTNQKVGFDLSATQLEKGNTATTFEPFNGTTANIPFGQTVAKGVLDITTGKLTITHGVRDMGTLPWELASTSSGNWWFRANVTNLAKAGGGSIVPDIKCEVYQTITPNSAYQGNMGITSNAGADNYLHVTDENYSDATSFTNAVNGKKVVYKLVTPTEIQLTPTEVKTLLGTNNIFADTGDIERIVYFKESAQAVADLINIILSEIDS